MRNIRKMLLSIMATALTLSFTGCATITLPEQNHNRTSKSDKSDKTNSSDNSKPIIFGIEQSVPSIEETPSYAFSYHYNSDYDGMVVDDYFLESPKVRIPDTLEGEPVTRVDMQLSKKNFTYLILPETVKSISLSYSNKKGLEYINVPRDMTCVDGYSGCYRLESIVIPDSVTSIDGGAFYGCTSLTNVTIPDSVTEIGNSAFGDCTSLTSVTIPDSVTEIGSSAFSGCTSLTSVVIPHGVTEISIETFKGCENLTNITIPDGVTEIGAYAFDGCTNLTNITIPDSVTEISLMTFSKCPNIIATYKGKTYDSQHIYKHLLSGKRDFIQCN